MLLSLPSRARRDSRPFQRSTDVLRGWIGDVCALLTILAIATSSASGQELEPLIGTWRLNFAESVFVSGQPPYKRVTTKIEPWQDGVRVIYDMVGVRGGVTHWEWTGRLDGRDYALQGVEEVVTNAYTRSGDRTYILATKVDGRLTSNTTIQISADGKKMTVTSPAFNSQGQRGINTAVYQQ